MERDMSQAFCRCGCGYYANQAFDGMCSKCYKDAMRRKQAPPATGLTNSINESNASTMVASLAAALNLPENLEQIEKKSFREEIGKTKIVKLEDDSPKPIEKDFLDTTNNDSASKSETPSDAPKTQKKKKTRCTKCKINVGCIGFPCRCGGIFCSIHRYANEHSCTFDYKEHGAEEIRKNNPQIVGEKIQKI